LILLRIEPDGFLHYLVGGIDVLIFDVLNRIQGIVLSKRPKTLFKSPPGKNYALMLRPLAIKIEFAGPPTPGLRTQESVPIIRFAQNVIDVYFDVEVALFFQLFRVSDEVRIFICV
jgi:hypothetical protein